MMRNLKEECKILDSAKISSGNLNEEFKIQTMNFGGDRTPYSGGYLFAIIGCHGN